MATSNTTATVTLEDLIDAGAFESRVAIDRATAHQHAKWVNGWVHVPRLEPLIRDFILLARKLEELGFISSRGKVIVAKPMEKMEALS